MTEDVENNVQNGTEVPQSEDLIQYTYVVSYARVSTDDKSQNPETQLKAIRKWAERKGDIIILKEFKDKSTGTNDDRPGLDSALGFIHRNHRNDKKHLITQMVIFDVDRLSRDQIETERLIDNLRDLSVHLKVITNEDLDIYSREGILMTNLHAFTAQGYVEGLGEKIKAGQQRAREEGKTIGRPLSRVNKFDVNMILAFATMGYSLRDVASAYNCSRTTITRRLEDEGKLDEFKNNYALALSQGKIGPALRTKKYKPKKTQSKE